MLSDLSVVEETASDECLIAEHFLLCAIRNKCLLSLLEIQTSNLASARSGWSVS